MNSEYLEGKVTLWCDARSDDKEVCEDSGWKRETSMQSDRKEGLCT